MCSCLIWFTKPLKRRNNWEGVCHAKSNHRGWLTLGSHIQRGRSSHRTNQNLTLLWKLNPWTSSLSNTSLPLQNQVAFKCFKCQRKGHIAAECSNKRVILINSVGEWESEDEDGEHAEMLMRELDDDELDSVVGNLLVVRWVLNVQIKEEDTC